MVSNGIFEVVRDFWHAAVPKNVLYMGYELAIILRGEVDVVYEPLLGPFEKLTFLGARFTNFKLFAIIATRTGMRL